jgi:hypothetical protein
MLAPLSRAPLLVLFLVACAGPAARPGGVVEGVAPAHVEEE